MLPYFHVFKYPTWDLKINQPLFSQIYLSNVINEEYVIYLCMSSKDSKISKYSTPETVSNFLNITLKYLLQFDMTFWRKLTNYIILVPGYKARKS